VVDSEAQRKKEEYRREKQEVERKEVAHLSPYTSHPPSPGVNLYPPRRCVAPCRPLPVNDELFHCPKPYCNKSYKQANGLKYHMTHGRCNFVPVEGKRGEAGFLSGASLSVIDNPTDMELKLEPEAEKRLRPFACGVGDCPRRYKNMNGLRYHYQHSGDHGAVGLALLEQGQHKSLKGQR